MLMTMMESATLMTRSSDASFSFGEIDDADTMIDFNPEIHEIAEQSSC